MSNDTVTTLSKDAERKLEILRDEKGNILLTDDQKKAVLERGRILVSASAGSGKTSTMVKRIIVMISEGASLKNLLVLVYNNAAADELKERLHQELFKAACSSTGEKRDRFRHEIDELPFCHICTIHAFCQSLIRENFDKLGISPTFEVLDETRHATYMNKALDDVIAAYTANGDETFCELADIFSQSRKEENLKSNIARFYSLIEIQPDKEDFKRCVAECYDSYENSKFFKILERYYKSFFAKAKQALAPVGLQLETIAPTSKYVQSVKAATCFCDEMERENNLFAMCAIASKYTKPRATISTKATEDERLLTGYVKDYLKQFHDVIDEMKELCQRQDALQKSHEQNAKYVKKLVKVADDFSKELEKLKQEDNVLSFEDLQHKALELLSDEECAQNYDFDAVFVDEYQDVNPTQEAIIRKLVKGECFMVGDVKQSIYGFRLADPAIFLSRQSEYSKGAKDGTNIFFNRNFRSAFGILNFVNGVFDSAMTQDSADVDYKKDARFELKDVPPVRLEGVSPEGYVQVHLFVKQKSETVPSAGLYDIEKDEGDSDEGGSRQEGIFIANEIQKLVGKAKGDGKYIGYGDIALLFRSRSTGAKEIVKTLKSRGIPVNEGAFGKSASLPERELVAFLRVLDNPRQDVPFAGYLLSYFGGYDESELASVAAEEGDCLYDKFVLTAYSNNPSPLADKVKSTLKTLDDYRLKASFESVKELMRSIVSDYCYDAYLMKSGEGDAYGLKAFVESPDDETSLGKFLKDYCESDGSDGGATGGDRVVVSTFHGYKGLENPVVFVADTAFGFNYEACSGDLILTGKGMSGDDSNNKGLVGMNAFDFENKTKNSTTLSKLAVSKCIKDNQLKEEIRLFYVALTRAKQLMYVTATVSEAKSAGFGITAKLSGAGCDLDFISSAVFDGTVKCMPIRHYTDDEQFLDVASDRLQLRSDEKLVRIIEQAQAFEYPFKQATSLAMKYSVSALDSADDDAVQVFEEAAKRGTAYHKVMQYIDYFSQNPSEVEAQMDALVKRNILTKEERDCVMTKDIVRCLSSDIMQIAREAEKQNKCHREQSFMMYKKANEVSDDFTSDDRVLVQGVIDLFIDGEKKIIVDFKTSSLSDEKTVEKYKKQLYLYKSAIESATRAKVDQVLLYSFATGKTLIL